MKLHQAPLFLGFGLLLCLLLPIVGLAWSLSLADISAALRDPAVLAALWLSLRTTALSLLITIVCGTPLAWFLAKHPGRTARLLDSAIALPIVVPPAVIGVGLLLVFGRTSALGGMLADLGLALPFTTAGLILAQVVVSSPFFVQAATAGFRGLDDELLLVARTLGASPRRVFLRVSLPLALPSLLGGATLCWARSLGEFGATLLFAGNFPGHTQSMPLAIYATLERDISLATAVAALVAAVAFAVLVLGRIAQRHFQISYEAQR